MIRKVAYIALASVAIYFAANWLVFIAMESNGGFTDAAKTLELFMSSFLANPLFGGSEASRISASLAALLFFGIAAVWITNDAKDARKHQGREYGSAHWLSRDKMRAYAAKRYQDNYLLSSDFLLSRDKCADKRIKRDPNRHVLVLGGSGSWKSSSVLDPNILQLDDTTNASFIVGDPKGSACKRHIRHLLNDGYKVKIVDFIDFNGLKFNMFALCKRTADIPILADMLIEVTTPPEEHKDFWTRSEHGLYLTCIGWLFFFGDEDMKTMGGLIELVALADASEEDENMVSPLDILIEDVMENYSEDDDEYYVVRCFDFFKKSAGKTAKSILSSCGIRLAPFNVPEVRDVMSADEVELERLGEEKTVLFCNFAATDKSYSFLVGFLFNLIFISLERCAKALGGRMPIPVTFHMDEVAQYGKIKDFDTMITFMRGYGLNLWLYLQADSQLNSVYNDNIAATITGGCDTTLFLGSLDYSTCEKFSKVLGNETIVVETSSRNYGQMAGTSKSWQKKERPLAFPDELGSDMFQGDDCIVKIKQEAPWRGKKTNVFKHPRYSLMDDDAGADSNGDVFDMASYISKFRRDMRAEKLVIKAAKGGTSSAPIGFKDFYSGVIEIYEC